GRTASLCSAAPGCQNRAAQRISTAGPPSRSYIVRHARWLLPPARPRDTEGGAGNRWPSPDEVRSSLMGTLIPFLLGLLVTAGLLVPLVLRLRAMASEAQGGMAAASQELAQLRQEHARLQAEQHALTQFLKDFPQLAQDLFTGFAERQVTAT